MWPHSSHRPNKAEWCKKLAWVGNAVIGHDVASHGPSFIGVARGCSETPRAEKKNVGVIYRENL